MWQPIETAPKDNSRPLWLAYFDGDTLQSFDYNGSWERECESWEMPEAYYFWASENGNVEEPTHWAYQPDEFYTLSGAQPASSVPREAIEKMLTQLMDIAVSNGANSISMPDEYVEVAAWLCGIPAQPAPSVPEDVMRDAERYRYLRARDDDTAGVGCWVEADGRACDRGWLYGVQLDSAIDSFIEVLAAVPKPEAKP